MLSATQLLCICTTMLCEMTRVMVQNPEIPYLLRRPGPLLKYFLRIVEQADAVPVTKAANGSEYTVSY